MASINVTGFDEVLKKLDKLADKGKVEAIAKKAIDSQLPSLLNSAKNAVAASEYGNRSSGSVAASMVKLSARTNDYGVFGVAGVPTGRDAKGVRNGAKAAYLQYGTPKMKARPWREKAVGAVEGQIVKAIEETVKEEMGAE